MSGQVFISHCSADRSIADDVLAYLEAQGLPCWIASRDVAPGANFAEEINFAISRSPVFALVLSRGADQSSEIKKEVALAGQSGAVVIPLRVEDFLPSGALRYELVTRQWIDVFADREAALERLAQQVRQIVSSPPRASVDPVYAPPRSYSPESIPPTPSKPGPVALLHHNLPYLAFETDDLVGREAELAELLELLKHRRCLTIAGSGGIGKTRLALRVGMESLAGFSDGVWLVELAPLADAGLVAEALCRVISAPVAGNAAPLEVAVTFLRQKRALLILDNCEHLLAASAELTDTLLAHCPGVSIVATSRESLKIRGEMLHRLAGLAVPKAEECLTAADAMRFAAVRLLVKRSSDRGGYCLTDGDASTAGKICRRLDGVAMAIELAAARMTVLTVSDIALRLENAFRLLNSGGGSQPSRHQTLWATINWSHSLLAPGEQVLLRRLSVFVDGFSLAGAMHVAQGDGLEPDDILDLLDLLVDKSLVMTERAGDGIRFRLLEATRYFAREKLKASDEIGRDVKVAEYLAHFYRRAHDTWPVTATVEWLAEFAPEVENLRAAIDWAFGESGKYHGAAAGAGNPVLGVELVSWAGRIADEMSLLPDLRRWSGVALAHITDETPPAQAGWLYLWSASRQFLMGAGKVHEARQQAIACFRRSQDRRGLSTALRMAAIAIARPGQMPVEVPAMLDEAVALMRRVAPSKDLATALGHTGTMHFFDANYEAARRYQSEAQAIRLRIGDRSGLLASAMNLAELDFRTGRRKEAIDAASLAAAEARAAGHVQMHADLLANLAGYLLASDRVTEAEQAAREALVTNRMLHHQEWAVCCLEHLALAQALLGAHLRAAGIVGFTEAYFRRTDQTRDPLEQAEHDRLMAILEKALPAETLVEAMAEGETWDDDTVDAVSLGTLQDRLAIAAA